MEKVIYKISNNINSKIYIGSTEKFNVRCNQHKHHLLKNTHHSKILQNHVNKYGFDSLNFEIIEIVLGNLIEREQYYIDTLNPYFNVRKIADSMKGTKRTEEQKKYMVQQRFLKGGYVKGWKHSPESIEKIKQTRLKNGGWIVNEETKNKISEANKGKKRSEETKLKISIAKSDKKLSKEHKENLSKNKTGYLNPMFGKNKEQHHNFGKKWIQKNIRFTKKIIDKKTGIIYDSINIASKELNIPKSTLNKYVLGYNEKITNFKYYE